MKRNKLTLKSRRWIRRRLARLHNKRIRRGLLARRKVRSRKRARALSRRDTAMPQYVLSRAVVRAPSCFSAINNPEQMSRFIGELKYALSSNPRVTVDLSEITDLAADGVALLLKHISDRRLVGSVHIMGTEPRDPISRQKLIDSGFFRYVRSPRGRVASKGDMSVLAQRSERVDNAIAAKVRRRATSWLFTRDRKSPPLYASLIECMANTRNHAHGSAGGSCHETWWLAVSRDAQRRSICVAFIDTGVGLFESVKIRGFVTSARRFLGVYPNTQVLKDMLKGEIESRTGLPYRGKGLPKIYRYLARGDFSRLVFVANDVYADVGADEYRTISPKFDGTLIYWEIKGDSKDAHNQNCR